MAQNSTLGGTNVTPKRRVRRRRTITAGVRSGAGTGIGTAAALTPGVMTIDNFGSYIRGAFEGFALANHTAPQQVLNGAKKYLLW